MDGFGLVDTRLVARLLALPGGAGGRHSVAARWLAPAVFLLAVTGVVLLVRSALRTDEPAAKTTTTASVARTTTTPRAPVAIASIPKQYYEIQSGDTLDVIAGHFGTTVAVLLKLNPGIEPTALHPGERVRVK
jgi:LysM repeat protein